MPIASYRDTISLMLPRRWCLPSVFVFALTGAFGEPEMNMDWGRDPGRDPGLDVLPLPLALAFIAVALGDTDDRWPSNHDMRFAIFGDGVRDTVRRSGTAAALSGPISSSLESSRRFGMRRAIDVVPPDARVGEVGVTGDGDLDLLFALSSGDHCAEFMLVVGRGADMGGSGSRGGCVWLSCACRCGWEERSAGLGASTGLALVLSCPADAAMVLDDTPNCAPELGVLVSTGRSGASATRIDSLSSSPMRSTAAKAAAFCAPSPPSSSSMRLR
jgi:hypothetical protein